MKVKYFYQAVFYFGLFLTTTRGMEQKLFVATVFDYNRNNINMTFEPQTRFPFFIGANKIENKKEKGRRIHFIVYCYQREWNSLKSESILGNKNQFIQWKTFDFYPEFCSKTAIKTTKTTENVGRHLFWAHSICLDGGGRSYILLSEDEKLDEGNSCDAMPSTGWL